MVCCEADWRFRSMFALAVISERSLCSLDSLSGGEQALGGVFYAPVVCWWLLFGLVLLSALGFVVHAGYFLSPFL